MEGEKIWKNGITSVFKSWTWKDVLLVVNTLGLFLVMLAYVTNPANSTLTSHVADATGAEGALVKEGKLSVWNINEPAECPSGGWLAPSPTEGVPNPWESMKITLRPARCKVKGRWTIEELDPEHNFRRMWSLKLTEDVEDKYQVLPYMLATQDDSLLTRPRRVYIDFGANRFDTSIYWMFRNYPIDFTEVYAFEVQDGLFNIPQPTEVTLHAMDSMSRLVDSLRGPNDIPKWMLDRINFRKQYISGENDPSQGRISATHFIKEELKLTKEDTVIIKMDIEGSEWDILPGWVSDPEMADIIDELFVEVHYRDDTMASFGWGTFSHSREEATDLLVKLREAGMYTHTWP